MAISGLNLEAPQRLRAFIRARESSLIVVAAGVGAMSGLFVAAMGAAVELLHVAFFAIPAGTRLSAQSSIDPLRAIVVPLLGGLVLGIAFLLLQRWRPGREIDPIEANALHGGYMSFRGSVIVTLQTIWSSGVGGSVGLEAGYTQISSGAASSIGRAFHLRRTDQRVMVGCGAAAAIAGAFSAPLAGAFYAFELVLGGYTPATLAPIGVAAVTGYATSQALSPLSLGVVVKPVGEVAGQDLVIAAVLGLAAGLVGIAIMRGVALCDTLLAKTRLWPPLRPALGGLAVGVMALATPHILASGHGALQISGLVAMPLNLVALVFVLKALASIVSLGSGFRGGLFFASLLLGSLGGHLFAAGCAALMPSLDLDPNVYAVMGMGALSASIIGGPMTMSFLALEATGNFWLTTAVLIAVIVSIQVTRELFGYSFATWRFHLRGETIRSAADVGWIRDLTVRRMMRTDVAVVDAGMPLEAFRGSYPLGSMTQVVAVDSGGKYAGIVFVAEAHGIKDGTEDGAGGSLREILHYCGAVLTPEMDVKQAVAAFDAAEAESLAVVDTAERAQVIGILTEAHALRRYAEESEKSRLAILG